MAGSVSLLSVLNGTAAHPASCRTAARIPTCAPTNASAWPHLVVVDAAAVGGHDAHALCAVVAGAAAWACEGGQEGACEHGAGSAAECAAAAGAAAWKGGRTDRRGADDADADAYVRQLQRAPPRMHLCRPATRHGGCKGSAPQQAALLL